jgi:hypothetical protein
MAYKTLAAFAITALLGIGVAHAQQQNWNSYHAPGSPYTNYNGSDGWSGNTYHAPGSPYTSGTFTGPNGQSRNCTTFRAPGSPYASTTCN